MGIPEAQLKTWSHQGPITQSSTTYNGIKRVLESTAVPYSNKNYEVFLQGSYQNATNIYAESDVDIVIRLNGLLVMEISTNCLMTRGELIKKRIRVLHMDIMTLDRTC